MFRAGEWEDVDDKGSFESGKNLCLGAVDAWVLLVPPALLTRSGNDPLVSFSVEVDARHLAEDAPCPLGVEAGQDDAYIFLNQFGQWLTQVVDEALRLGQLNVSNIQ